MRACPRLLRVGGIFFLVTCAAQARAGEPAAPAEIPDAGETSWYGWQTLAVDSVALGLMASSFETNGPVRDTLAATSLLVYAVGPLVVHAVHDRPGVGVGDLGLRVGAPLGFGVIGLGVGAAICSASESCSQLSAALFGAAIGGLAGYLTAVVLDAAWLSNGPAASGDTASRAPAIRWSPQVGVSPRGEPSFGLVGAF